MSEQVLVEDLNVGDVIEWEILNDTTTHMQVASVSEQAYEDGEKYVLVSVEGIESRASDEREYEPGSVVWRCY